MLGKSPRPSDVVIVVVVVVVVVDMRVCRVRSCCQSGSRLSGPALALELALALALVIALAFGD